MLEKLLAFLKIIEFDSEYITGKKFVGNIFWRIIDRNIPEHIDTDYKCLK